MQHGVGGGAVVHMWLLARGDYVIFIRRGV
jgi:hypothetical protein